MLHGVGGHATHSSTSVAGMAPDGSSWSYTLVVLPKQLPIAVG